jgi:hypothetical protein
MRTSNLRGPEGGAPRDLVAAMADRGPAYKNPWRSLCAYGLIFAAYLLTKLTAVRLKPIWPRATYCDLDMFWQF